MPSPHTLSAGPVEYSTCRIYPEPVISKHMIGEIGDHVAVQWKRTTTAQADELCRRVEACYPIASLPARRDRFERRVLGGHGLQPAVHRRAPDTLALRDATHRPLTLKYRSAFRERNEETASRCLVLHVRCCAVMTPNLIEIECQIITILLGRAHSTEPLCWQLAKRALKKASICVKTTRLSGNMG